ncbi:hypothetical protein C0Q70_08940 [Pomacea canaliculata]|uniref:Uncharacterized protein n=1 Tax=Pomacea canaliculata TaxID=400727 RepID=A0A2T7P8E1_POMCA|nr:hypothetical protein C0Q70_08940 [Pomacea canaliculata]
MPYTSDRLRRRIASRKSTLAQSLPVTSSHVVQIGVPAVEQLAARLAPQVKEALTLAAVPHHAGAVHEELAAHPTCELVRGLPATVLVCRPPSSLNYRAPGQTKANYGSRNKSSHNHLSFRLDNGQRDFWTLTLETWSVRTVGIVPDRGGHSGAAAVVGSDVHVQQVVRVAVPTSELLAAHLALQVEGALALAPVPQHVLRVAVRLAAAATLVARSWPSPAIQLRVGLATWRLVASGPFVPNGSTRDGRISTVAAKGSLVWTVDFSLLHTLSKHETADKKTRQDNQLTTSTFSQMLAQGKGYGAAMLFISQISSLMEPGARPQPWLAVLSSLDYPLPIFVSPIIAVGYLHQALHSNMFCRIFYPVSDAATDLQVLVVFVHVPPIEPHATQVTGEVVVTDTLLPVAEEVALVEEELAAARARKRLSGTWLGGSTSGRPAGSFPGPSPGQLPPR